MRASASSQRGIALIVTLLVTLLLSVLGLSLALIAMTEQRVAASFRNRQEVFYAADAALERVVEELGLVADWSLALDGSVTASLVDPAHAGDWPDELAPSASIATAILRCGRSSCTDADIDRRTQERPWGANNPRWQLFAYGPLSALGSPTPIEGPVYVAAWVADDALENDGNPLADGGTSAGPNPGRGIIEVVVQAYGTARERQVIEATLARTSVGVRVLSWRAIR